MDLTTEPQYLEKDVLQMDFMFLGGANPLPVTLETSDQIIDGKDTILIVMTDTKGQSQEITILKRNLLYYRSLQTRVRTRNPQFAKPFTVDGTAPSGTSLATSLDGTPKPE